MRGGFKKMHGTSVMSNEIAEEITRTSAERAHFNAHYHRGRLGASALDLVKLDLYVETFSFATACEFDPLDDRADDRQLS